MMDNIPPGKHRRRRKKRNSKRSSEKENTVKTQPCKTNETINNNFNRMCNLKYTSKNITKQRLTKRYGIFAKGSRSETITRLDLSEEFVARSNADLHKIIDLASGEPKQKFSALQNKSIVFTPPISSTPRLIDFSKSPEISTHKDSKLSKKLLSQKIITPSSTENETDNALMSSNDILHRKFRSIITKECEKYFSELNYDKAVTDTKNYLKKKYENTMKKHNLSKYTESYKKNNSVKETIIFDPSECLQVIDDNCVHKKNNRTYSPLKSKNVDALEYFQMFTESKNSLKSTILDSFESLQMVNENNLNSKECNSPEIFKNFNGIEYLRILNHNHLQKESLKSKKSHKSTSSDCLQITDDNYLAAKEHCSLRFHKNLDPIAYLQMANDNHVKVKKYGNPQKPQLFDSTKCLQIENDNYLSQRNKKAKYSPIKSMNIVKMAKSNSNNYSNLQNCKFDDMIESSEILKKSIHCNDLQEDIFHSDIWETPERQFYPRKINYKL